MFGQLFRKPRPTLPPGERVYAIGDVHGRLDLLNQLFEMIRADHAARADARALVVLLGDLIDRGPDSRGVVERIRQGLDWARTIPLMGNHEAAMLNALEGSGEQLQAWLRVGGNTSLVSWGVAADLLATGTRDAILAAARAAIPLEDRGWIGRLRTHLQLGDYYFVHAGVRPGIPLYQQAVEDNLWIRDAFLESRRHHGAMIVHGHSVRAEVEERPNRIGIDTGAYASDRLTALGIEGQARWILST